MKNNLIIIETLPVIKYHLEQLSIEIKEKIDKTNNLIVNNETVKEIKKVRANLNKEFNDLEIQRKKVKSAIMSKYDEFEEIYKENVSNLYKKADIELKLKIDNVENQLKKEKENELREFAEQHIQANELVDFIKFEDIGLNITLSASISSLKDQIVEFCNKIRQDLDLIELEEFKEEILVEYKNNLDFAKSKIIVSNRHKQMEELKKQQEKTEQIKKEEEKIIEKVEEITTPKEIIEDDAIIEVQFKVKGTKEQIKQIKNLILKLGVEYE